MCVKNTLEPNSRRALDLNMARPIYEARFGEKTWVKKRVWSNSAYNPLENDKRQQKFDYKSNTTALLVWTLSPGDVMWVTSVLQHADGCKAEQGLKKQAKQEENLSSSDGQARAKRPEDAVNITLCRRAARLRLGSKISSITLLVQFAEPTATTQPSMIKAMTWRFWLNVRSSCRRQQCSGRRRATRGCRGCP